MKTLIVPRAIGPALLLTILILCRAASTSFADTPVVKNTAPRLAPLTLELEEQWRVGGDDGEHIFGLIIDAAIDEEGNVYLLDNQLCQVEVFDPDGGHLRTLSRRGEGPGEVRTPMAIEWLSDGSLAMMELFPSKLETIAPDGTPRGSITLRLGEENQTGFTASIGLCCRKDVLISAGHRATTSETAQERLIYLSRFDQQGRELMRFCEARARLEFAPPRFVEAEHLPAFYFASAVGPDGRVYASTSRVDYRIAVFDSDGAPVRVIERDFKPWIRDERDRRRMNALIDAWFQRSPGEVARELSESEQTLSDMFVDEQGRLWVQHSRSGRNQPDGILLTYDTFDPDGRYRQEVSVACPGDAAYDGLKFLGDGRVLVIKGWMLSRWAATGAQNVDFGEDQSEDSVEVICYRIAN